MDRQWVMNPIDTIPISTEVYGLLNWAIWELVPEGGQHSDVHVGNRHGVGEAANQHRGAGGDQGAPAGRVDDGRHDKPVRQAWADDQHRGACGDRRVLAGQVDSGQHVDTVQQAAHLASDDDQHGVNEHRGAGGDHGVLERQVDVGQLGAARVQADSPPRGAGDDRGARLLSMVLR
jgi:hypothetical protein